MSRYLLDTNIVIALLNNREPHLAKCIRRHRPVDVYISSIVIYELFYGAFKSQRKKHNLALVEKLQFEVLDFDKEDGRRAGEIRAILAARGTPVGPYDILIAGQASVRNLILVTHNIAEFRRVPGLQIEDWVS